MTKSRCLLISNRRFAVSWTCQHHFDCLEVELFSPFHPCKIRTNNSCFFNSEDMCCQCVKLNWFDLIIIFLTKTIFFWCANSLLWCKNLQTYHIPQLSKLLLVLILCIFSLLRVWAQLTGRRISARSKWNVSTHTHLFWVPLWVAEVFCEHRKLCYAGISHSITGHH